VLFEIAVCAGVLTAAIVLQATELVTRPRRRLQARLKMATGEAAAVGLGAGAGGGSAGVLGGEDAGAVAAGENPVMARRKRRIRLPSIPAFGRVVGQKYMERMRTSLTKSGVPLKPEELAGMSLVFFLAGVAIGLLSKKGPFITAGLAFAGLLMPGLYVSHAKRRRAAKLESQLVDALTLIANSLRAGHSFMQALELVSHDMAPPLAPELARVLREARLGLSVDEAFGKLVSRFDSRDLELVITGVLIQRQVGGNLAVVLDGTADTIGKRLKARAKVRTLTAQGRLSAWVISIMPFGLAGLVFGLYPDFGHIMLVSPLGIAMLVGAAVLLVVGVFVIRKVVNVDV
jgi:tight adherence protein B